MNMQNVQKIAFLLFLIISQTAFAQQEENRKIKADKYYDHFSYQEGIKKYEAIKNKTIEIKRRLGESYYKVRDFEKSEQYYSEVVKDENHSPQDVYNYASVSAVNQKYDQYAAQMNEYYRMKRADQRAVLFRQNTTFYKDLLDDKGQFSIKLLSFNSGKQDFGPSYFHKDIVFASSGKEVKFIQRLWTWNKKPFLDLYQAETDSTQELKKIKRFVTTGTKVNKKFHEGPATFNKEGTLMAFTRNNYKVAKSKNDLEDVKLEIFFSDYKDEKWSEPIPFKYNNDIYSVGHPALTPDGKTMYFASDQPGGYGGVDLYVSHRAENGEWSKPENLGKTINTEGNEMFPFIGEEGILFFASNGLPGLGGLDIFYTQKRGEKYMTPRNAGTPVNGAKDDFALIISIQDKIGYFSSSREDGKGNDDIYSFKLLRPLKLDIILKGKVIDEQTREIIAGAKVQLQNTWGEEMQTFQTDENGNFEFVLDAASDSANLIGSKENYLSDSKKISVNEQGEIILELGKQQDYLLLCKIIDNETEAELSEVKITADDQVKYNDTVLYSNVSGESRQALTAYSKGETALLELTFEKDGYLPEQRTFNQLLADTLEHRLTVRMRKPGDDYAVGDLLIKNIYFDFDKSNIRPDAAKTLNEIVEIMNAHPTMRIEFSSHTDCRGSYAYNKSLSSRRAKSSQAYIRKRISNPTRIYGKGYGETRLVNDCACEGKSGKGLRGCSKEEHQANRRTEFKIIEK